VYTQPHSAATTGKHRRAGAATTGAATTGASATGSACTSSAFAGSGDAGDAGDTGELVDGSQARSTIPSSRARMADGTPMRAARLSDVPSHPRLASAMAGHVRPAMDSAVSTVP